MAIASAADRDPVPGPPPDKGPAPEALRFRRYAWSVAAASWIRRTLAVGVALWLALPGMTGAQSVPAFTGRYRFILRVSPSCPPGMQVGPVSLLMDVVEVPLTAGSEVSGQPASAYEGPNNGRFVLLRQGNRLHGPYGAHTQYLGLDSEGIYRVWMQVMTDGVAATSSNGRARASGTAFGEVELGFAGDPTGKPIDDGKGNCGFATGGHEWSLEPA